MDGQSASGRVHAMLSQALSMEASDVHLEPNPDVMIVRYRVGGNLAHGESMGAEQAAGVIIRIKLLAGMDIAERRIPQDGAFHMPLGTESIDVRVSSLPTIYGEKLALRLLRGQQFIRGLDGLGLDRHSASRVKQLLAIPFGMILATGPTGSGKTTTLYALLQSLSSPSVNIVCLEDPVEYRVPGLNQVEINARAGLTFATGLRSVLRQDPNVIMVGEIRDRETAEIAVRAALTGQRVFSSLHTGSAVEALVRLLDMGIEAYLVASSVTGVISQRLLRRACVSCRADRECPHCYGTGVAGRVPVFEVLIMNDLLRRLLIEEAPTQLLNEAAVSSGMRPMKDLLGDFHAATGESPTSEVAR